jgi:hypothetical protein
MPTTLFPGNPDRFQATYVIASMGFVTTIYMQSGEYSDVPETTFVTTSAFAAKRSSRLMPGFLGKPAVMTTMSDPAVSSNLFVPMLNAETFQSGTASARSRALPCGTPSAIS